MNTKSGLHIPVSAVIVVWLAARLEFAAEVAQSQVRGSSVFIQ